MVIACWSVKGGSGTTVVAAALGVIAAHAMARPTLLVDLAGDVPGALGVDERKGSGVTDWLARVRRVTLETPAATSPVAAGPVATAPGDLASLEHGAGDRLSVVASGSQRLRDVDVVAGATLARVLQADGRCVVVDAGTVHPGSCSEVVDAVVSGADRSVLVTRACYLALRNVTRCERRIDAVVLIEEPGRSLGAADVESVTGAPVVARVRFEPQIARVVDAGLLSSRLPRSLERPLAGLLEV